jgi:hypothetical protein
MTDQIKRPSFSSSLSSSSFNTILTGHEQCKRFFHNDKFSYINSRRALTLRSIVMDTFEPAHLVTALTSIRVSGKTAATLLSLWLMPLLKC